MADQDQKYKWQIAVKMRNINVDLVISAFAIALIGCATGKPQANFSQAIATESRIADKDEAKVKVEAGSGVKIAESDKARLIQIIEGKIDERKIVNSRNGDMKTYEVDLLLTGYERGNEYARRLVGLGFGRIHFDGEVTLLEMPGRTPVGKFTISKTFASGGGSADSWDTLDIEKSFADGIAAALTGLHR